MGTTTPGIPYPEPSDPIANGAVAMKTIAETLPGKMARGLVTITPTAANTLTYGAVTFPAGKFTTPPDVMATSMNAPSTGGFLSIGVASITATGCNIGIVSELSLSLRYYCWLAIGK